MNTPTPENSDFPDCGSRSKRAALLKLLNLALLILYPIAWTAPLMRAGVLPLFGLSEISVLTGLQSLWETDILLALVVIVFALLAPYLKTLALVAVHFGLMGRRALPMLHALGKLAMAEVFLIALYVVVIKGIGIGRIEVAWGLYLLTGLILMSLWVSYRSEQSHPKQRD